MCADGTSMCIPILTLVLESVFHIIVSFSVNLCNSGLQSSIGEISENCDFWLKMPGGGGGGSPKICNFFRLKSLFIHSAIEG